jgi:penicillin-binding protein 2
MKTIPLHAKTGTAEVAGKQTTSWFSTYTKDYAVVMTISQGGTGSGASGEAVRKIYSAMYGLGADGKINKKKALLPHPPTSLPKITGDGAVAQLQKAQPHETVTPGPSTTPSPHTYPAGTGTVKGTTAQALGASPTGGGPGGPSPGTAYALPPERRDGPPSRENWS